MAPPESVADGRPRSLRDLWLALRVLVLLIKLRVQLRFVELPLLLARIAPTGAPDDPDGDRLARVRAIVDGWIWRLPEIRTRPCLVRSVLLWRFARRAGLPVEVTIGVRKQDGRVQGHSWLTLDGEPYLERATLDPSWQVIFRSGADAPGTPAVRAR